MAREIDLDRGRVELSPAHEDAQKWLAFVTHIFGTERMTLVMKPQADGSILAIYNSENGRHHYFFHVFPDGRINGSHDLPQIKER